MCRTLMDVAGFSLVVVPSGLLVEEVLSSSSVVALGLEALDLDLVEDLPAMLGWWMGRWEVGGGKKV